jgi:transaldolase
MTQIFLDTANLDEIKEILKWGIVTGVTTNQKIFLNKAKGCDFKDRCREILFLLAPYPVSIEGPNDFKGLIDFAYDMNEMFEKCKRKFQLERPITPVIKVPMLANGDGLKAVQVLARMGLQTNVTACMNIEQVYLAANAGATYVSLFYNRMRDHLFFDYGIKNKKAYEEGVAEKLLNEDQLRELAYVSAHETIISAMDLLKKFDTKLIVGSIRSQEDVRDLLGIMERPHIITITYEILKQMPYHPKTETTLKDFEKAWEKFNATA